MLKARAMQDTKNNSNRKKPQAMVNRATEKEFAQIKEKIKKSKLTSNNYLLKATLDKEIPNLILETKRIGTRISRLTKLVYQGKVDYSDELEEINQEMVKNRQMLSRLINHLSRSKHKKEFHQQQEIEKNINTDTDFYDEIDNNPIKKESKYGDPEMVMVTYQAKDHIHNHFIINTANKELHAIKIEYGTVKGLPESKKEKEQAEEKCLYQKQNNVKQTALAVEKSKEIAVSKEQFMIEMRKLGYKTNWTDTLKYVTFINIKTEGRVRLARLERYFEDNSFTKESLIKDFERNYEEMELQKAIDKNIIQKIYSKNY